MLKFLRKNLISSENKIIVTTIQKLNILIKRNDHLAIYDKQVVLFLMNATDHNLAKRKEILERTLKNIINLVLLEHL